MKSKWSVVVCVVLAFMMTFSGSVFAFSDVHNLPGKDKIMQLKNEGVINGESRDSFAPKGKVTYAQGVHMIVKALELNIDNLRFIKPPKASDYFSYVKDNAWYAESFIIAHLNGLTIPKAIDPKESLTREQFARLLAEAIHAKGDFAIIEIWIEIADEKQIHEGYMDSIQMLLITKIAELDENNNFRPQAKITRAEAAIMLHGARKFVKDMMQQQPGEKPEQPDPDPNKEVTMTVEKVSEAVNKVIVSWGSKPNTGYGITIDKIEFNEAGQAVIYYNLRYPEPGKMYAEVITEPKAETYVSSAYKPVIKELMSSDSEHGNAGAGVSFEVKEQSVDH